MEQKLTHKELRQEVKNLFEKIEKKLKLENPPPVELLVIIHDIQDLVDEKYPIESSFVISEIDKHIHLFEKSRFERIFSIEGVQDWLLNIKDIYKNIEQQGLLNEETAKTFKELFDKEDFKHLVPFFEKICDSSETIRIIHWMTNNKITGLTSIINGETPLHFLARINWNNKSIATVSSIAKKLKENYALSVNDDGQTPLDVAVSNKNLPLVKILSAGLDKIPASAYKIAHEAKDKDPASKNIYAFFTAKQKSKKKEILKQEPLQGITKKDAPINATEAICSQVYYEGNKDFLTNTFIHQLNVFTDYEKSPLFAPLLYVVALATLGKHDAGVTSQKPKFLKAVLTSEEDVKNLTMGGADATGAYKDKNTLFGALGNTAETAQKNMRVIFHEASHFVALEVMKNACSPYKKGDEERKIAYQEALLQTHKKFDLQVISQIDTSTISSAEEQLFILFSTVFTMYPEAEWEAEMFVLFAEAVSILGYEKGCEFLEREAPELFQFYKEQFYPQCIAYLKEHQVQDYLELDASFLEVLTPTQTTSQTPGMNKKF
jgi:hypothetical protein